MVILLQLINHVGNGFEDGRFKDGEFSFEDKPRSGQPKKFEDKEALLEEDQSQTQEKLAESLGVIQ